MKPSILSLTRLEFEKIHIEFNPNYVEEKGDSGFPQLDFNFNNVVFEIASSLAYPDQEIDDPRHFTLMLRLSIKQESQETGITIPYSISIEGRVYLYFKGNDEGLPRFKAVRNTGYMMLWGAFREQVANFTSRSGHGLWFLPSPNFTRSVEDEAPKDMESWENDLSKLKRKAKRSVQRNESVQKVIAEGVHTDVKILKARRKKTEGT